MYSKLYARITESSLMEERINVRYTFVLMLAIADPEGYVIGTDVAIARRLNMPLAEFESCLRVLMAPDENSNSKDHEGRRVLVSDGERGYRLVNYVNYRDMKSPQDRRDYMRDYMRKRRSKTNEPSETIEVKAVVDTVNVSKPPLAQLRHGDGDGDGDATDKETQKKTHIAPKTASAYSAGFESWWKVYPRHEAKGGASKAWIKSIATIRQVQDATQEFAERWLIERTELYADARRGKDQQFTPHPNTWLNDRRFDDDPSEWQRADSNSRNGQRGGPIIGPGQVYDPNAVVTGL